MMFRKKIILVLLCLSVFLFLENQPFQQLKPSVFSKKLLVQPFGFTDSLKKEPIPFVGEFRISSTGSSVYNVPFVLPPWENSLKPKIGLNYNSDLGESFIGESWQLTGFSQISLCTQNYFSDKTWTNVSAGQQEWYSLNRFCLNGQRLVSVKGQYGKDGTEYRTSIFNGMRIISKGICGNGPCSFEVSGSDGTIYKYGSSQVKGVPSAILTSKKDIYVWGHIESIDLSGNRVVYEYKTSNKDDLLYPAKVSYGGNNKGKAANRSVSFFYKASEKRASQYKYKALTTKKIIYSQILDHIETRSGNELVLTYRFDSSLSSHFNGYVLNSFNSCSSTSCFSQTDFSYEEKTLAEDIVFKQGEQIALGTVSQNTDEVRILLMDKYGTGHQNIGLLTRSGNQSIFSYFKNDGAGKFKATQDSYSFGTWIPTSQYYVMDKNGDGLDDLIAITKGPSNNTVAQAFISQKDQVNFRPESQEQLLNSSYNITGKIGGDIYISRDINGDGLSDLVELSPRSKDLSSGYSINTFYNSKSGGFPNNENFDSRISSYINLTLADAIDFQDINGDSLHDAYIFYNTSRDPAQTSFQVGGVSLYRILNQFQGPRADQGAINFGSNGDWEELPAYVWLDYNGDGLNDLLMVEYSKSGNTRGAIWINSGGAYKEMLIPPGETGNQTQRFSLDIENLMDKNIYRNMSVADLNGDGRSDLLIYLNNSKDPAQDENTNFAMFINNGLSFDKISSTQKFGAHTRNFPMNLNNDGVIDIVSISIKGGSATLTSFINQSEKTKPLLKTINNGIGGVISINYGSLLNLNKGSGGISLKYPYVTYNRHKVVVSDYQKENGGKNKHGYVRSINLEYNGAVFNRQNWQLSSFLNIREVEQVKDTSYLRGYYVKHPFVGREKSYSLQNADGSVVFNESKKFYESVFIAGSGSFEDNVLLVRKSQSESILYGDPGEIVSQKTTKYSYFPLLSEDGTLGNLKGTETIINGTSNVLYNCYTYQNIIDDKRWIIGLKTGVRKSTNKNCDLFTDVFKYKWDPLKDHSLSMIEYHSDNFLPQFIKNYYYNKNDKANEGWSISELNYNDNGLLESKKLYISYQNAQSGKFYDPTKFIIDNYEYDDFDFLKSRSKGALGSTLTETYIYDSKFGRLIQQTSANGKISKQLISDLGFVESKSISQTEGNIKKIQSFEYGQDDIGYYLRTLNRVNWNDDDDSNWSYQNTYFDGFLLDYRITLRSWDGEKDIITKDVEFEQKTGRVLKAVIPSYENTPEYLSYEYTPRGQIKTVTAPNGRVVNYKYDYSPGVLQTTTTRPSPQNKCNDSSGKTVSIVKIENFKNNQTQVTFPNGEKISHYLNLYGQSIKTTDGRGLVRQNTYDSLGRHSQRTLPDSGKDQFFYNGVGLNNRIIFNDKSERLFDYNNFGQVIMTTSVDINGSKSSRSYKYGEEREGFFNKGKLTTLNYESGLIYRYNYSLIGYSTSREVTYKGDTAKVFLSEYGPLNQLVNYTTPDGVKEEREYYNNGLLKLISYNNDPKKIFFSDYTPYGKSKNIVYSNNVIKTSKMDAFNNVTKISYKDGNSKKTLFNQSYCYNNSGLLIQSVDTLTNKTINYDYSLDGRLLLGDGKSYNYDLSGNLVKKDTLNFKIASDSNHLISASDLSGKSYTFKYDGRGRLSKITESPSNLTKSFLYNSFGRLREFNSSGGTAVEYNYGDNGLSLRNVKSNNGSQFYRFSNNYERVKKFSGESDFVRKVRIGNLSFLTDINSGGQRTIYSPVRDRLGNLRKVLNKNGETVEEYSYSPYGSQKE